jgi:hypothetical protein
VRLKGSDAMEQDGDGCGRTGKGATSPCLAGAEQRA